MNSRPVSKDRPLSAITLVVCFWRITELSGDVFIVIEVQWRWWDRTSRPTGLILFLHHQRDSQQITIWQAVCIFLSWEVKLRKNNMVKLFRDSEVCMRFDLNFCDFFFKYWKTWKNCTKILNGAIMIQIKTLICKVKCYFLFKNVKNVKR